MDPASASADFGTRVPAYLQRVSAAFDRSLPAPGTDPPRLHEAMRYACEGGKRVRALLVYATGETLKVPAAHLDSAACAVELIHAYSLVHDDLPAMDDDDLRRGRPTVHKAYDEAIAILVGDTLQTLAFSLLAADDTSPLSAAQRVRMIASLAHAAGSLGMVGGQAVDMASENKSIPLADLESLHLRKTGALIRVCGKLAADAASAPPEQVKALERFGNSIGLAFQVQDDVLDVTVNTEMLGKTGGKDLAQHKSTFPALLGLEPARERTAQLFQEARDALKLFGKSAAPLLWLADHIERRKY
ncbi:MAG: polyprenyl synthetase family protein [Pseudomonadota bacterium]